MTTLLKIKMKFKTLIFFAFIHTTFFAQFINTPGGVSCDDLKPICWDPQGRYTFENVSDVTNEGTGKQVACLDTDPRPSWFYFKIAKGGDVKFRISQWADLVPNNRLDPFVEPGLDVDFVVWGPFNSKSVRCNDFSDHCSPKYSTSLDSGCPTNTTFTNARDFYATINTTNVKDCSYSIAAIEEMHLNNVKSGDYYVLLVTNYSNIGLNGLVQIEQINLDESEAGTTDCSIVDIVHVLGDDSEVCDVTTLNANPNQDQQYVHYFWEIDTGSGFVEIPNTNGERIITVNETANYRVSVTDLVGDIHQDEVEITVKQRVVPLFNAIVPISFGDTLSELPTTSINGITGSWSPILSNLITKEYTFIPDSDQCGTPTNITVVVAPFILDSVLGGDLNLCGVTNTTLNANPNESPLYGNYFWEIDTGNGFVEISNTGGKRIITVNETGAYRVTVTDSIGNIHRDEIAIIFNEEIVPLFNKIDPICSGDELSELPTTSLNGITGSWSPELTNLKTEEYIFTPDAHLCATNVKMTIGVISINKLDIEASIIDNNYGNDYRIKVTVKNNNERFKEFEYSLDNRNWQESNVFDNVKECFQTVYVRDVSGCNDTGVHTTSVLDYPKFFTPNGDAINDRWNIHCLKNNTSAVIYIFNRYGALLKQIRPSYDSWDGTYRNRNMPSNDYWFKVEYLDKNDGVVKTFSSHFTLKR
ncbi:T9SS type B sorting domain-containing protein [Aquimarina aquimarini]|uniref:T9SS type B sorting domain-containing protein n=2 Tax=Aquimarina aquimarini TaxID=1191734 RepID=UPI000D5609EA|nr:T9SS type B sorting domain-containing protein [Aquimarina aquimarini]